MYRATLLMIALMLTSCANWRPATTPIAPPRIDCNERAAAEPPVRPTPKTTKWRDWAAYARRWQGVAGAEVAKRAEVADCLDREREAGRIR